MNVHRWYRPRLTVKALMMIPVVCAIVFYAIEESRRISPERRRDIEHEWVSDPLGTKFLPSEGARVRPGDPLLKVAWIISKSKGHSWLVTEGGMIGDAWNYGFDAGGKRELNPVPYGGFVQLSACLKQLPPSDLVSDARNSLIVAYPSGGIWAVRRYRGDSVPKEADDIARALNFHSSYDGKSFDHWIDARKPYDEWLHAYMNRND